MSDQRINLAKIRTNAEEILAMPAYVLDHGDARITLALVKSVEAAHQFLDLDYGYLSEATKGGVAPLVAALARFDFGERP